MDAIESAMLALGDQIEAAVFSSSLPIAAVVILNSTGEIEYRSKTDRDTLASALMIAAEALREGGEAD
jgi:hypothetical protein